VRIATTVAGVVLLVIAATAFAHPPFRSQGMKAGAELRYPVRLTGIPHKLRRRLRLPHLPADATCPVSTPGPTGVDLGLGLGKGPAYPIGFDEQSTLHYAGVRFPRPWTGNKVLWVVEPSYRGPVLIRGRQLNGRWWLGFDRGERPYVEMHIAGDGTEWTEYPSYTRVRARGCYGYQIDGRAFSRIIVFRVAP